MPREPPIIIPWPTSGWQSTTKNASSPMSTSSPKVWVFSVCWNEALLMPYFLRHYSTLASQIIIWDEQSTDGTREIIQSCPKAQLRDWPCKGLDDDRFLEAVNNWYKMARGSADWVMWPDIDEILYHPNPLQVLASANGDMVHATGYAMISKGNPPSGEGQIYDELRTGCRQNNYDKWIIWRPGVEIQHTAGRHTYGWQWPRG